MKSLMNKMLSQKQSRKMKLREKKVLRVLTSLMNLRQSQKPKPRERLKSSQ
jgi:hypothetical protein